MPIIIYFAAVAVLYIFSRFTLCSFVPKHGRYVAYILPAVMIPLKRILRKDHMGYGTSLMSLYGTSAAEDLLAGHWAMKLSSFILFASFPVVFLSLASPGNAEILLSLAFPVTGFFIPDLELKSKITARNKRIMTDYPVFCTDIAVMAGSGMEITAAWKTASSKRKSSELYKEARMVTIRTGAGMMFSDSLREFAARLCAPEINTFVTVINQEIKAGSGGIVNKLMELAALAWKKREDDCRAMGEKAASKLVFPLAMGLAGILLILAAPAVMVMKGL